MRTNGIALDHGFSGEIVRAATKTGPLHRQPELSGQAVVVIGGSRGIGLELQERSHPYVRSPLHPGEMTSWFVRKQQILTFFPFLPMSIP